MLRRTLPVRASLALIFAGFFGLCAAAIALPHDPYIRWQSLNDTIFWRMGYFYERLHFDRAPVDVVVIGSSRSQFGIDASLVEDALRARGRDLRVLNMSVVASGMDFRVAQAREVFRARPNLRLLIVPVVEALPRDGHQAFGAVASLDDIVRSPLLINRNLPATWASLPMRQMTLFAATQAPEVFGYKGSFDSARYRGTVFGRKGSPNGPAPTPEHPLGTAAHRADLDSETVMRSREVTLPILPPALADVEFGLSRESVRQISELAQRHGTRLVFLFQPYYKGLRQPAELYWLRRYGPVWSYLAHMDDPDYFRDAGHPSEKALPELNYWFAGQIANTLPPSASQPRKGE